ncbi:MAG: translation elongation factor-like protein [Candidatus Omnitrophica bacterium]|nr:translation elongation factor-like protein [Candidatus Omnitrophota bacterium]
MAPKKKVKKTIRKKQIKKKTVKKPVKRSIKKKTVSKKKNTLKKKGNILGVITHYFPHVQAAVIKLKTPLSTGETIKIKGHTTDFTQSIISMQIDHVPVNTAKTGQEIGLLVNSRVRQGDLVYKV